MTKQYKYEIKEASFPLALILSLLTRQVVIGFEFEKERRTFAALRFGKEKEAAIDMILSQHPELVEVEAHNDAMDPNDEAWLAEQKKKFGESITIKYVEFPPGL